jgi:predicted O-methyltransferase YrrM
VRTLDRDRVSAGQSASAGFAAAAAEDQVRADRIELRLGPAQDTLAALIRSGASGSFDFAFIDADKTGYDGYYEACIDLVRGGGLILLDNALQDGAVVDPAAHSADIDAMRAINRKVCDDPRVDSALLTIGDGVVLARKR